MRTRLSLPEAILAWPRRRWPASVKVAVLTLLTFLFIVYDNSAYLRTLLDLSKVSDKLHNDIFNSTLGFEKIVVLNLPTRSDRRDALTLAAAFSQIKLDWVDGVQSSTVSERNLPPGERIGVSSGGLGSWRGHMNAIRGIVEQNLGSALILEDDVDWDIRLKPQLQTFAKAAQALLSPGSASLNPPDKSLTPADVTQNHRKTSFSLNDLPRPPRPQKSPYGDEWDMLWLGHCGTNFHTKAPISRILIPNDPTVPSPNHLRPHPFAALDTYGSLYPPHTRLVHYPAGPSCSLAYALSQRGARKLLYEFGVKAFDKQLDFMLGDFCENTNDTFEGNAGEGRGRDESQGVCITVQPPLFGHHFPEGAKSDIIAQGGGLVRMVGTLYVRWSVRMNFGRLVSGKKEILDQWPD